MRHALPLALILAPLGAPLALAERFELTSRVAAAELYPSGATLLRRSAVELPAGQHELVIDDLPAAIPIEALRIAAEGLSIGSVTLRRDDLLLREADEPAEAAALRAALEALEAEAEALADEMAPLKSRIRAAEAELRALESVELAPDGARPLSEVTADLRAGIEAALAVRLDAAQALRPLEARKAELDEEIEAARRALEAALPAPLERARLIVAVEAAAPVATALEISYLTPGASWQPVYDMRLARAEAQVSLTRGANLRQMTGEDWQDVAITLSTVAPSGQLDASQLFPWWRHIEPAAQADKLARSAYGGAMLEAAPAPMAMPAADVMEGLLARYSVAGGTDLASGAEGARISLGEIVMPGEIFARAVPEYDEVAYLAARLRNETGEPLLPAPVRLFVDGVFVGQQHLEGLSGGGEAEISFGPIEGLRLRHETRAQEGEGGLLRSRNERQDRMAFIVENQTNMPWDLRMLARVPYSEQEQLNIAWVARPMPDLRDFEGRQGVHEWRFELAEGAARRVELDIDLSWPEEFELR